MIARKKLLDLSFSSLAFQILGRLVLGITAIICLLPFLLMVSSSLTTPKAIARFGFRLIPREFTTEAYRLLFRNGIAVSRAYGVSVFVTAIGSFLGLMVISMAAYAISRPYFSYRNQVSFYFYFTTLFSGGLLSVYILFVRYLNLKNNLMSLILPLVVNVLYILIMRNLFSTISSSIFESAKIDGAGELVIFFCLALPLSGSTLATIGLFLVLDYWNDWYNAMLYISDHRMFPLQYMLYNMLTTTDALRRISSAAGMSVIKIPSKSLRLAMAVVAAGPVLFAYPFVQKFFVKGVHIGAVKG